MLEHRRELWLLGKKLIAGMILQEENGARGFQDAATDWLPIIFRMMVQNTRSLDEFLRKPVSFVTFNYDRLVEFRLINGLHSHYGCSIEEAIRAVLSMPILHVHGYIGPLYQSAGDDELNAIPFGSFKEIEAESRELYRIGGK